MISSHSSSPVPQHDYKIFLFPAKCPNIANNLRILGLDTRLCHMKFFLSREFSPIDFLKSYHVSWSKSWGSEREDSEVYLHCSFVLGSGALFPDCHKYKSISFEHKQSSFHFSKRCYPKNSLFYQFIIKKLTVMISFVENSQSGFFAKWSMIDTCPRCPAISKCLPLRSYSTLYGPKLHQ